MMSFRKPISPKSRILSLLLMLAVWVASLCVMMSPAHACCPKKASVKADSAIPACCVSHATVLPQATPQPGGTDPGAWVAPSSLSQIAPHGVYLAQAETQSLLAHRHVPDQSNRHQELEVWLN